MSEFLSDYTVRIVVLGSALIGATSGALGCFAYLRRQSLMGDVVSHASLLGIVAAFWMSHLITGEASKSLWILIPGALFAGLCAMLLTRVIVRSTKLKQDAGLGVMLAMFFGTGMALLRWLQRASPPISGHAGLEDYLFGMPAAMGKSDLTMILCLSSTAAVTLAAAWPRLKIVTFDAEYATGLGISTTVWEVILLSLLVLGIVIGLHIMGVVLMVAMLVAPASAARQWTDRMGRMACLAAMLGAACATTGALVSSAVRGMPTGPVITILLAMVVVFSVIFSPKRGLLYRRRALVH